MDIERLKQELIRDEGVRYSAYQDTLGLWTIGVGRLIDSRKGGKLTQDEVDLLLQNDIQSCVADVVDVPAYHMLDTDNRQRAFLNMRFQLGHQNLLAFNTFLSLLEQKKFKEAADDLRTTKWYSQVPSRAERICQIIEKG